MGFGLWLDRENRLAWVEGTQEYRAMGAAVIAVTGQFGNRDFHRRHVRPKQLENSFAGFFGSLEEVNEFLRARRRRANRATPAYL